MSRSDRAPAPGRMAPRCGMAPAKPTIRSAGLPQQAGFLGCSEVPTAANRTPVPHAIPAESATIPTKPCCLHRGPTHQET